MKNQFTKRVVSLVLVVTLVCTGMFVPKNETTVQAAKKASLKTKKITLTVGKKKTIKLKNKKKGAKYTFKVKKASVAKVSKKGVVTAKKAGKTEITVKEKRKKKTRTVGKVKVTVKKKRSVPSVTPAPEVIPTPIPSQPTPENPTQATPTPGTPAGPFKLTDEIYAKFISKSVFSTGNNARIKKVIEKARAGEDVTLAYIGGSITEGALAKPNSNCYASVSAKAFGEKYGKNGGENVHYVNAGMSGTPSSLGIIRYDRDVLGQMTTGDHPDILFIEFAVNDYGECTKGGAYEGLIRRALESGSAVFLVFSIFQSGRVMESTYKPYGTHYDLPMVSMGDAIQNYFSRQGFKNWYFGDSLHPNNTGHKLMSDCIMETIDRIDKEAVEEENAVPAPINTDAYTNTKFLSKTSEISDVITEIDAGGFNKTDSNTGVYQYPYNGKTGVAWFPENWMHTESSGSASFKATVQCKTLMVIYKFSSSQKTGSADLYVDGKKVKTLNGYQTDGWNNASTEIVFNDKAAATHKIEVKMAAGSENKEFTLMGFGYAN